MSMKETFLGYAAILQRADGSEFIASASPSQSTLPQQRNYWTRWATAMAFAKDLRAHGFKRVRVARVRMTLMVEPQTRRASKGVKRAVARR